MFKVLVLQTLYNLSDEQVEYQIRDRISFMRFLGLGLEDGVPDATTVWLFREALAKAGLVKTLFERFNRHLDAKGYIARGGQIIDGAVSSNSSGWRPRPLESSSRVESVLSGVNCLRSHAESAKMGRLGPYNNTTAPIACSVRTQTFTFSVLFEVPWSESVCRRSFESCGPPWVYSHWRPDWTW